jgi:tripartite-type tricarboxylate transporter receptor subunit TctC
MTRPLPELPTISDFLPDYEATQLNGLGAPKNTPAEIVSRINKEISAALDDPRIKVRPADLGTEPEAMTPAELSKVFAEETEKWAKLIRSAGIKVE